MVVRAVLRDGAAGRWVKLCVFVPLPLSPYLGPLTFIPLPLSPYLGPLSFAPFRTLIRHVSEFPASVALSGKSFAGCFAVLALSFATLRTLV